MSTAVLALQVPTVAVAFVQLDRHIIQRAKGCLGRCHMLQTLCMICIHLLTVLRCPDATDGTDSSPLASIALTLQPWYEACL